MATSWTGRMNVEPANDKELNLHAVFESNHIACTLHLTYATTRLDFISRVSSIVSKQITTEFANFIYSFT